MAAPTDILTDLRGPLLSAKDMFLSKLKDRQLADSFKLITMDDLCNTEKELELQIRGLKNARGSGRIEPLIKAHKEYGGVLETVVQAGPEILCLSWGPLKALLLVPSTEKQAYDMVVIMLGELGQSFPDFKPYETWFLQSEDLCRRLPVFFEDLLQVYAKSLRVFESRSWKVLYMSSWRGLRVSIRDIQGRLESQNALMLRDATLGHMSRTQRAEAQTSERSTALGPDKQGTESCISARQLCDGCSVILSAPGTTASNSGSVELFLESLLYIRGTNCGFCQLVRDAVFEELRLDPTLELNPRSSFKLQWHDTAAPGGRAGFKILGLRSAWIGFGDERKTSSRQLQTDTRRVYIKARLQPVLNIQQVSGWINHCTANHKACLARQDRTFQELFPGLQVLRLIDVQNDCLVETPPASERYVALSYVWGEIRDFTLTQANRQELMQPGTMSKVWKNIPVTIKDAIDLVRTLGLRDLWVDCICLMQNDAEDLNRGLEVMDRIFAQAWFTLVAACGHDANAGLPGVRPGRRKEQILLNMVAPGVSLGVFFGPDAYLRQSIYETRAWTFQVHVISGRILYFVDNQVFFRCQQAKYLETCEDHPNLAITSYLSEGTTRYPLGINQTDHPLGSYSDMLTQYTRRTLKNQSDILWDMAGVMRRFSEKLGSPTIQGMPACALGRSLLFTGQNLHRRNGFPSYSWAGWQGKIQFPAVQRSGEGLELVEWIDWYETPGSGRTSILVLEGPRDIDHTSLLFTCQGLPPDAHAHRRVCKGFDSTSGESMSYPLLSFWTVAIILQVKIFDVFHGYGRLIGKDGVTCGAMVLDQPLPGTESLSAEPFEFVLLSEGSSQLPGAPELDNSLQGTCGYYHVILVVWEGGVAERRGVGTIAKEAIAKGFGDGAIWKEIALG